MKIKIVGMVGLLMVAIIIAGILIEMPFEKEKIEGKEAEDKTWSLYQMWDTENISFDKMYLGEININAITPEENFMVIYIISNKSYAVTFGLINPRPKGQNTTVVIRDIKGEGNESILSSVFVGIESKRTKTDIPTTDVSGYSRVYYYKNARFRHDLEISIPANETRNVTLKYGGPIVFGKSDWMKFEVGIL